MKLTLNRSQQWSANLVVVALCALSFTTHALGKDVVANVSGIKRPGNFVQADCMASYSLVQHEAVIHVRSVGTSGACTRGARLFIQLSDATPSQELAKQVCTGNQSTTRSQDGHVTACVFEQLPSGLIVQGMRVIGSDGK